MEAVPEREVIGSVNHLGNLSHGLLSRASGSLYQGREGTALQVFIYLVDIPRDRVSLSLSLGFYLG